MMVLVLVQKASGGSSVVGVRMGDVAEWQAVHKKKSVAEFAWLGAWRESWCWLRRQVVAPRLSVWEVAAIPLGGMALLKDQVYL
jgi:hypothetical protein